MALGFGAWRFDLKMALSTNKYLQDIPKSLRDEDDLSKVGLSSFEKTVDAIEDKVTAVHGQATKIQGFYSKNEATITSVMNTVASESVKQTAKELLAPAKKLVEILDGLGNLHPYIKVATSVFSMLITMEITRRENDRKIAALIDTIREMMQVLTKLGDVGASEKVESKKALDVDLELVLKSIGADIHKAGNMIDTYYKQKFLVKFFASSSWEGKFLEMAKGFETQKGKIEFCLSLHVTVILDTVAGSVVQIESKIDFMMKIFQQKSEIEEKLETEVELNGGRQQVLGNRVVLQQMADMSQGSEGPVTVNATLLYSLRSDVEELMEDNKAMFELKMVSLQSAVERSAERILTELRAGAHEQIIQPDVRQVWKDMHWRTTVKSRNFVLALHDYYADRLSGLSTTPSETNEPPERIELADVASLGQDRWCFRYLSVRCVPDISSAIDRDASGYINISEINDFLRSIPSGWTLPQWLAFWAIGWHYEATTYRCRIATILTGMQETMTRSLPENRMLVVEFIDSEAMGHIVKLVSSLIPSEGETNESESSEIVQRHMLLTEARLDQILKAAKFEIDSTDSMRILFGDTSVEKYMFSLLYCVLRHYWGIIQIATKEILDEKELQVAAETLGNIVSLVDSRFRELRDYHVRPNSKDDFFQFYAHGLYSDYADDIKPSTAWIKLEQVVDGYQQLGLFYEATVDLCSESDEFLEATKNFLRFPLISRGSGDPLLDTYFNNGLEGFDEWTKTCIEIYKQEHLTGEEVADGVVKILLHGALSYMMSLSSMAMQAGVAATEAEVKELRDLSEQTDKLLASLDSMAESNPLHRSVGITFRAVAQLTQKQCQTDARIAFLLAMMAEVMHVVMRLSEFQKSINDTEVGETEKHVINLLNTIKTDIVKAGNVIDAFGKKRFIAKFFELSTWEDKLIEIANQFNVYKGSLEEALRIYEHSRDPVTSTGIPVSALRKKTDKEGLFGVVVDENGGRDAVLNDDNLLRHLNMVANIMVEQETSDPWVIRKKRVPDDALPHLMRPTVDDTIEQNRSLFELRVKLISSRLGLEIQGCRPQTATEMISHRKIARLEYRKLTMHLHAACDVCAEYPIEGVRYKCIECKPTYDLCGTCASKLTGKHAQHHLLENAVVLPEVLLKRITEESKKQIESPTNSLQMSVLMANNPTISDEKEAGARNPPEAKILPGDFPAGSESLEDKIPTEVTEGNVAKNDRADPLKGNIKRIPPPYELSFGVKLIYKRPLSGKVELDVEEEKIRKMNLIETRISAIDGSIDGLGNRIVNLDERLATFDNRLLRIEALLQQLLDRRD